MTIFSADPHGLDRATKRARRKRQSEVRRQGAIVTTTAPEERLPDLPIDQAGLGAPGRFWDALSLARPPHETTSDNLAGAMPFLAEAGLGSAGPVLGINAGSGGLWHFSPWDLYGDKAISSTNLLVIGAFGAGKSGVIKQLVWRSLPFGRQVVVPSDSKGEWVEIAEAAGGQVIRLGGKSSEARLNPLDRGPRARGASDLEHERMVLDRRRATLVSLVEATLPRGDALTPMEHTALNWALMEEITTSGDRPTIRGVFETLSSIKPEKPGYYDGLADDARRALHVLARFVKGDLSGLFEDESTVAFDDDAPIVVVDTSALFARGELAATCAQICTTNWVQAVISDKGARRTRYLIREEGWRDMNTVAALQAFRQWLKLSRDYGISVVVILHKVADFDAVGAEGSEARALAYSIFADIANKFVFQQPPAELERLQKHLGLTSGQAELALDLSQGTFIAKLGSRYTYLVDAFVTSTPQERALFETDAALLAVSQDDVDVAVVEAPVDKSISAAAAAAVMNAPPAVVTAIDGWRPTPVAHQPDEHTVMIAPGALAPARLEFSSGQTVSIHGPTVMGRRPSEAGSPGFLPVVIEDESRTVSKSHLEATWAADGLWVVDCGSANGTAVETPEGLSQALKPFVPYRVGHGFTIVMGESLSARVVLRDPQDAGERRDGTNDALRPPVDLDTRRAAPTRDIVDVSCPRCNAKGIGSRYCIHCGADLRGQVV